MPEVGDLEKPKMVFFFDEAHLLFNGMPNYRLKQITQVVKLIRSRGIGIYFISQAPTDIPDEVIAQLGNRVKHTLRAYTPAEEKTVKVAAGAFRTNPGFNTEEAIKSLGVKIDAEKNDFRGEFREISTDDSSIPVYVVPTNEELMIALDTYEIVNK
jgi:DNA helicase HerA-like ATPase